MKKSEIRAGEAYAVYVPVGGFECPKGAEHPQSLWGVSRKDVERGYGVVRGVVVADGVERWSHASGPWSRGYDRTRDGFLVRLDEPLRRRRNSEEFSEVVLSSRNFVEPWSSYQGKREAEARSIEEMRARYRREADTFEPRLAAVSAAIEEAGLGPVRLHRDASGVFFEGGSIPLRRADVDGGGNYRPTGFDPDARIRTDVLLRLVGVEAEEEAGVS